MVENLSVWKDGRLVNSDERNGMGNGFGEKTRISLLSGQLNRGQREGDRENACTKENPEFEELDIKTAAQA